MAFSAVMSRAVGAVRAYFQKEWNEKLMESNDIPAADVPVICQTYVLLGIVFAILALFTNEVIVHLGIASRSVYDVLYVISIGLFSFRVALNWARHFSFFYGCAILVSFLMTLEEAGPGFDRDYSPFCTKRVYMTALWSMMYATAYSQVMVERIKRTRDINEFNHALCFFTDFPFVAFRFCRMMLREYGIWVEH